MKLSAKVSAHEHKTLTRTTSIVGVFALGGRSEPGASPAFFLLVVSFSSQIVGTVTAYTGDRFGSSVALNRDGHILLIGAWFGHSRTGAAYVFTEGGNSCLA